MYCEKCGNSTVELDNLIYDQYRNLCYLIKCTNENGDKQD
jgi:hypothetical protein